MKHHPTAHATFYRGFGRGSISVVSGHPRRRSASPIQLSRCERIRHRRQQVRVAEGRRALVPSNATHFAFRQGSGARRLPARSPRTHARPLGGTQCMRPTPLFGTTLQLTLKRGCQKLKRNSVLSRLTSLAAELASGADDKQRSFVSCVS